MPNERQVAPGNTPMKLSARVFKRRFIVFVCKASLVKDVQRLARRLVAPPLMGRAVRAQPMAVL